MKNSLAVLSTILGLAVMTLFLQVAKANADRCTAGCPSGFVQTSSCPVVSSACAPACTGVITCVSSGTTLNVPCHCVGVSSPTM